VAASLERSLHDALREVAIATQAHAGASDGGGGLALVVAERRSRCFASSVPRSLWALARVRRPDALALGRDTAAAQRLLVRAMRTWDEDFAGRHVTLDELAVRLQALASALALLVGSLPREAIDLARNRAADEVLVGIVARARDADAVLH
jgi:hypothetical protein